ARCRRGGGGRYETASAADVASTAPPAPSACTATYGALVAALIAVSKPELAPGVPPAASADALAPASTCHATTPDAPFQLAAIAVAVAPVARLAAITGGAAGWALHGKR